jgi:bile acid:Na+ symporter, BASS family
MQCLCLVVLSLGFACCWQLGLVTAWSTPPCHWTRAARDNVRSALPLTLTLSLASQDNIAIRWKSSSRRQRKESQRLLDSIPLQRNSVARGSTAGSTRLYTVKKGDWARYYRTQALYKWLPRLTTAFPLYVVVAAIVGYRFPWTLAWINQGSLVTLLLAAVMAGAGLTLQRSDFTNVWATRTNRAAIPLGIACQFGIMPLSALLVGQTLLQSGSAAGATVSTVNQALFVGLCLVGCAPGGTASNLVTLIAGANVALSVILTTCSTLAAVVLTPLLVKLLAGTIMTNSATAIQISGWALCAATAKVVVLPILAGMWFKAKSPKLADTVSRYTPLASVLLVSLICGGVVAQTAPLLTSTSSAAMVVVGRIGATPTVAVAAKGAFSGLGVCLIALGLMSPAPLISLLALPLAWRPGGGTIAARATAAAPVGLSTIVSSVLMLHLLGFGVGYMIPKLLHPNQEKTARTISIEVGMQNSALAVVLARSIPGLHPAAALPGAISATVHSCVGSLLAAIWRLFPAKDKS